MEQSLDIRRANISRNVKLAGGAVACLVVAPLTFFILQGLIGILALAAAGIVAFTLIQLAPWYADKVANWRMKLITHEAQKNPVETMKNEYVLKMQIIQAKDQKIAEFAGRLDDFKDKMVQFGKRYPEELPRYQEVVAKMTRVLDRQKQKQRDAKLAAVEFKAAMDKGEAIYEMACAAHDVSALAGDIEQQVFRDIKTQVAFDAINHKFNTAVAELTVETDTEPDFSLPATTGAAS